jgi:hypothetical protein
MKRTAAANEMPVARGFFHYGLLADILTVSGFDIRLGDGRTESGSGSKAGQLRRAGLALFEHSQGQRIQPSSSGPLLWQIVRRVLRGISISSTL